MSRHKRNLILVSLLAGAAAAFSDETKEPDKKKGLPLTAEREVAFDTDEGTWLSLDVSPDGKTVVFELLGDLYTVPIAGGEATRITSGMAFDSQPRYSPDGKSIAFLSDRDGAENLWIAKADGSEAKALSKDQQALFVSPDFLADGDWIAVSRRTQDSGTAEVWMYHVKGGSGVQVTKASPKPDTPRDKRVHTLGVAASRDGRHLYYAQKLGDFLYNVPAFPLWQIKRRDLKTGDEDTITDGAMGAFRPALSPDGKWLAYITRHETDSGLRLLELATGEERWLRHPVQRDDQESRATRDLFPGYDFTPDSNEVVITWGGKIHRVDVASGRTTDVPFKAQVQQSLGPLLDFPARVEEGPVRARLAQGQAVSPDGKRVAFSALTRLYVMDLPPGQPKRVSAEGVRAFQPAWSPDGRTLAYVTWSVDGGHVWTLAADGRTPAKQVSQAPAFYTQPAFTPDGGKLVLLRGSRRVRLEREDEWSGPQIGLDVVWIAASGGPVNVVIPARGLGRPHFGTEADRVYFASPEGLISLRLDGTDRRVHLKLEAKGRGPEPTPASDARISPDGRFALAKVNQQLYVSAVPAVGATTVDVRSPQVAVEKLTTVGVDSFDWADGGRTIVWGVGSSLFRRALASVRFEPKDAEKEAAGRDAPSRAATADATTPATPAPATAATPPAHEEIELRVEQPRYTPRGSYALRGARAITMRGDEVIDAADILVENNRIKAIGPRGSVALPAGVRTFDVSGHTVIPGIVDTHAHWTEVRHGVLDTQSWTLLANLAFGVTTGRDPQTMTNDMLAYQDLVDTGELWGPRAYSTGPGVFADTDFQSYAEARDTVAKYGKHYRTHTLKSYMVGNRRQRQWMVQASKEHRIMPTTEGGLDLKLDLTHVIDGFAGNEHSLPIVPLYKDVVELVAQSKLTYTPTLLVAYGGPWAENYFYATTEVHDDKKLRRFTPHHLIDQKARRRPWFRKDEHVFPKLAEAAGRIIRAGGRVGIGGHGQLQGIQCHWEMWALAEGGLKPHEVLKAATLLGATGIGLAQDLGSLEAGKLADMVVLSKDPLADIRNTTAIRYVVKNGEVFDGESLDRIWPSYTPLPALWWWNDDPQPAPASPDTDVFVADLTGRGAALAVRHPRNLTQRPGYDNQPRFSPDGRKLYFTSGEGLFGTDVHVIDLATARVARVAATPEGEFSPAPTADGRAIDVVRVEPDKRQRLWRVPLAGGSSELLLPGLEPVGYFAWIDADTLAAFVLGSPPSIELVERATGTRRVVVANAGRSVHKVPGRAAASFVHKVRDGEWWIKEVSRDGSVSDLARTRSGREDYTWTPDGTLLMADGSALYAFTPGRDTDWREVARFPELGTISRMAVSPQGDRLALVGDMKRGS